MKITLPDSWSDVTLRQFQEMDSCESVADKIAVLANEDPEDIRKMDVESYKKVSKALSWTEVLPSGVHKDIITLKDEDYVLKTLSSLSLGEWTDIETYIKDSVQNIHKIMAVLYHGKGTNAEKAEVFLDNMNILDAYSCLVFFSLIEKRSLVCIEAFFKKEILRMEMNQKLKQKQNESKEKQKKKKQTSGHGSFLRTILQRGILRTWKKYSA